MKLTYTRAHNLAQLAEELVAALPALVFVNAEGRKESRMTVSGDGVAVTLTVPDGTAEASVAAVVNAHTERPRGVALSDNAVRPIVTGSRSNGAAMTSLLRRLAQAGLIEDHTTP